MRWLFQALQPCSANPLMETFINDVFDDECVVNAYFFPKCMEREGREISTALNTKAVKAVKPVVATKRDASFLDSWLPLEEAGHAARQAGCMKLIQPKERHLAQLAAFVSPCGLFYLSHVATVLGPESVVPTAAHTDAMREMLLEDALHKLRSRHARLGNTLAAVLGLTHDDDIDDDQVARITTAVYLANVKLNAIWTGQRGKV